MTVAKQGNMVCDQGAADARWVAQCFSTLALPTNMDRQAAGKNDGPLKAGQGGQVQQRDCHLEAGRFRADNLYWFSLPLNQLMSSGWGNALAHWLFPQTWTHRLQARTRGH